MDDQQRIRERAHQLWEQEGRPHGREKEHWERAARELGLDPAKAANGSVSVVAGESAGPNLGRKPVTVLSGDRAQEEPPYATVDGRTGHTG